MTRRLSVGLILALVVAGCATTGSGTRIDRTKITRTEIEESGYRTAMEVVQALRPTWLQLRGNKSFRNAPAIPVYIDGVPAGDVDMLRQISTQDVEQIEHYDARRAQFKFGVGHEYGAIEVTTRG